MTDITLTNPLINSGNPVYLRGATLSYSFKPLTRTTPITGSDSLSETQCSGIDNPKINITGYIDVDCTDINLISQSLLLAFAKNQYDGTVDKTISLSVTTGSSDVYLRNTDDDANSLKVVMENFSINMSSSGSKYAGFWNYSMTLVETL